MVVILKDFVITKTEIDLTVNLKTEHQVDCVGRLSMQHYTLVDPRMSGKENKRYLY